MCLCDEPTERELLGCLLVDVDLRRTARRILRPDDFYLYHHRLICQAIFSSSAAEFYRIGEVLAGHSLLTEVGGGDYIRDLAVQVENYALGLVHAQHIAQLGRQRRILHLAEDMARAAVEGEIDDISRQINKKLRSALRSAVSLEHAGRQMQLPGLTPPALPSTPLLPIRVDR